MLGAHRWAEIEPLSLAALLGLKESQLFARFHTFRDDPKAEALAHADHRAEDETGAEHEGAGRIGRELMHERLVDFQHIDRKLRQIAQARIARSKIIDSQLNPHVPERPEHGAVGL